MRKLLTKTAMLELWRLVRADEPLRLDCTLTRTDAVDRDSILEAEMRAWYLNLLDCAPVEFLAPIDMAIKAEIRTDGCLTIVTAPDQVRRILGVRFAGWAAAVAPTDSLADVKARAGNPFWTEPVVANSSARSVVVANASGELVELMCAADLSEEAYCFDDRALEKLLPPGF